MEDDAVRLLLVGPDPASEALGVPEGLPHGLRGGSGGGGGGDEEAAPGRGAQRGAEYVDEAAREGISFFELK